MRWNGVGDRLGPIILAEIRDIRRFHSAKALKLAKPKEDPVYLFMLKKEQEGKPYNVAKMTGVNM